MLFLRNCLLFFLLVTGSGCAGLGVAGRSSFDGMNKQMVEVRSCGLPGKKVFQATLIAWEYEQGRWRRVFGPWPAVAGRNGFASVGEKKEGDGKTPSGKYGLGIAFGKEKEIRTGLIYRQTTEADIWIDDASSGEYNQWVKLPTKAASYEKMRRDDGLYDLGIVIKYNTDPVVPGDGSAIFIHIWRNKGNEPTAGCIGLDSQHLSRLLEWLRTEMHPAVLLGKKEGR